MNERKKKERERDKGRGRVSQSALGMACHQGWNYRRPGATTPTQHPHGCCSSHCNQGGSHLPALWKSSNHLERHRTFTIETVGPGNFHPYLVGFWEQWRLEQGWLRGTPPYFCLRLPCAACREVLIHHTQAQKQQH